MTRIVCILSDVDEDSDDRRLEVMPQHHEAHSQITLSWYRDRDFLSEIAVVSNVER